MTAKELLKEAKELDQQELNNLMEEAARKGFKSLVEFCIKAGANVNADDDDAIQYASENGHAEVVKLLIEAGADVTAVNYKALKSIIDLGDKELIALALESIENKAKNKS